MRNGMSVRAMRLVAPVVMAALLASCATTPRTLEQLAAQAVRRMPALAPCEQSQQLVALDRLQVSAPDLAAYDVAVAPRHARTRGPNHAFRPPSGAEILLTMFAPGDPHQQEYTDTSSIVWKDADGWHFEAVHYRATYAPMPRPPGETPHTPEEYDDLRRRVERGRLSTEQVAALEAALADPCLGLQPASVPIEVPWADGRTVPGCMGGFSGGTVAVTRSGRRQLYSDLCGRWAAGRIMRVVLYPRIDTPPPPPRDPEEVAREERRERAWRHERLVSGATLARAQPWETACASAEPNRQRVLRAFAEAGVETDVVEAEQSSFTIYSRRRTADRRASYYFFRASDALCAETGSCMIAYAGRVEGPLSESGALLWSGAASGSDAFTERLTALGREIAANCR